MTRALWLYLLDVILLGLNDLVRRMAVVMLAIHLLAACIQSGPYAPSVLPVPPLPVVEPRALP